MLDLILGIITGLLILVVLVVVHELGHAIVAHKNGVVVKEFGIGLPPSFWSRKLKNGVLFSLNWLMIGGFVKLKGEYNDSEGEGTYGSASFWQKTKILLAGVSFNIIFAILIISTISLFGLPRLVEDQFYIKQDARIEYGLVQLTNVEKDSAADSSGFLAGDKIIKFAGQDIKTDKQLVGLIEKNPGKVVDVDFIRDNQAKTKTVQLADNNGLGRFGVGMSQRETIRSTWSAPVVGLVTTFQFTRDTIRGVYSLLTNLLRGVIYRLSPDQSARQEASGRLSDISKQVAGPIGIVGVIFPAARQAGLIQLMLLAAIISISLAVMNILPIPALDGGRWLTMALFKLFKKKLTVKLEGKIQTIGFFVIIAIALMVTILDVKKIL